MIGHSVEARRKMYLDMAKEKEEKEKRLHPEKFIEKPVSEMFNKNGDIR